MSFGPIFWITTIILVVAYIALEIGHAFSRRTGTVIQVHYADIPGATLIGCDVDVAMDDGREVQAKASGCVLCQTPLRPGLRVALVHGPQGWMIDGKSSCGKAQ